MLFYLYRYDYADGVEEDRSLVLHASMYALGDKYHIKHLKYLAKQKFSNFLEGHARDDAFFSAVEIF